MRNSATRIVIAACIALLGSTLAGCGSASTAGTGAPAEPSGAVTPSAAASASTGAASSVLFTISANVRGTDGSTIGIRLTAHKPLPYSDRNAAALITKFIGVCGGGVGGIPVTEQTLAANGSILLRIDLASSVVGKPFVSPVNLTLGSAYFGQAATGKGITPSDPQLPCYNGYSWTTSGSGQAIADFESGIPGPDLTIWKNAYYGFSIPAGANATIEACRVTLSTLATTTVASVDGWDPTRAASGTACGIGYSGE